MFDFLDEQADKHSIHDTDVRHTWKSNWWEDALVYTLPNLKNEKQKLFFSQFLQYKAT